MARFLSCAAALTVLVAAPLAQAQVNKCVDAAGKTVYSQSPCSPNSKSSAVRQEPPTAPASPVTAPGGASGDAKSSAKGSATPSGPKTAVELEQEFRKRRTDQDDARKKEQEKLADAKGREDNCRSARAQLAGLEATGRQSRTNDKGDRYFLDDAQVATEIEKSRKAVQDWCK